MSRILKQFLKDFVASKVTLTDEKQDNVQVAKDTVDKFISCMQKIDPLFNELYQRIHYAGSYYEKLKVNSADEFDHNIVLNLPFRPKDIQVIDSSVPKGFVKYKLTKCCLENQLARDPKWPIYKDLDKIMDPTHQYLSSRKFNAWFQSLVKRTMNKNEDTFSNVKYITSGPAITLTITSPINNSTIRVDLVPVVELHSFPDSVTLAVELREYLIKKPICFIVPKPPADHIKAQCNEDDHAKIFRVSMPDAEKLLLEDKGCVKMLVKIFKALRDKEGWTFLPSYYIKTVFMWQLIKHPETEFWKEEKLDQLFIEMLKVFIEIMTKKSLDHIFFEDCNLLQGPQQFVAVKNTFEKILTQAQSNVPSLFITYSLKSLTLTD